MKRLTKFEMAYELLRKGGNYNRFQIYYTFLDSFSYAEIKEVYDSVFN